MTDPVSEAERAERIRRLQERRVAPAGKKRHPAAATRWLLGGVSVASFFTIAGTVAFANHPQVATSPAGPAPSSATVTVPTGAQPSAATPATAQTTRPTTAPAPHTTTRGS